ncbi:MAG: hypothetical protein GDA49_12725 [Rhodospirillales bacterium]|nr:hypothetical protein [Rhodospirillales bacterium]
MRRLECQVPENWKLIAENAMEAYHTGTVHGASLGQQATRELAIRGHWDAIQVLQKTSIAVLPGETIPFAPVKGLSEEARAGTFFTTLHPNTQLACVRDCMWWMTYRPVVSDHTVLKVGQCFPRATTERDDFETGAVPYFHRWDTGIDEDKAICEAQQAGLSSRLHRQGRFSANEQAVYRFNNRVFDQVLNDGTPQRRI